MAFPFKNIRKKAQTKCFLCDAVTVHVLPRAAVVKTWVQEDILIQMGSACCPIHIRERNCLTQEAVILLHAHELEETFYAKEEDLLFLITSLTAQCRKTWTLDFEDRQFSDYECNAVTGLSCPQVYEFHTLIQPQLLASAIPMSTINCTAAFLMKLRLNISQKVIGVLFGNVKQQRISEALKLNRSALHEFFAPPHLGCHHITREEYISQ